jgi:flagellar motility protein MotE (MotC chaperone)
VGGFGSNVLKPILKDIPVVNYILPGDRTTETEDTTGYLGYTNLKDAVDQIKALELELEQAQSDNLTYTEENATLKAEVARLKTFEDNQVEFQRIKTQFYEEVVYAENGPGAAEYQKYYEAMDPTTAEYLYKQVVQQLEASAELQDYATAYSAMKPKAAAAIFEAMTDNLDLAAEILGLMSAEDRGNIMGAMTPSVAAKITKIMDPNS